jgi:hypothetical protein
MAGVGNCLRIMSGDGLWYFRHRTFEFGYLILNYGLRELREMSSGVL